MAIAYEGAEQNAAYNIIALIFLIKIIPTITLISYLIAMHLQSMIKYGHGYFLFQVNFTLKVEGYSGNAGDSLLGHNGYSFSTIDKDNDIWDGDCASTFMGAWW